MNTWRGETEMSTSRYQDEIKGSASLTQYLVAVEDPVAAIPLGVRPHTLKITEKIEVTSLRQHITDKRLIGLI